ncbi:ABC transporter permease [Frigidibacter sp. RF13]|uniref:ABC transporter permease n=1 Tax=Frigidibacter sp. RF13 TaxID=2997340 RepID=UPI0022713FDD|nr:ABC transporter permease [Frigidibacter sp. RF13]MCY1127935.1 ABC transporter permease [Frigidibacter sp. RF13]
MTQRSNWGRLTRSPAFNGYALISPTALYALLLLAAPLATVVYLSFQTDGSGVREVIHQFTLRNYLEAWTDPIYRAIMQRSLFVSFMVTLATVVLAFPVAYFVSFHVAPNKKSLWLFLITIPFWTSYLVRVFLWKVILGYNGVINSGLKSIGLIDDPLTWINVNVGAIVMTLAHAYAPFAILPIFVALEKIDRSLLEAGRDLGESALMTFWRVTLPLAMPGVVGAVLIVFIPTVGDYVTPDIIGGGKIPLIANVIQKQLLAIDNMPLGSAVAVSAMLIVGVISAVFVLANARFLRVKK